ncbi:hypothetical protein DV736_g6045, partial [Chaetothyriales sp. CBS 134916]
MVGQLRIAIIGGCGLIGRRHCQHVFENTGTRLSAIVDPSPAARGVAETYEAPLYASIQDMLNDQLRVDAAIVCTPNQTHVSLSEQLAKAGIHILCEKPISSDVDTAIQLIRAARDHDIKLLIGHHRRFNPYILALKTQIDSGALGSVTAVNALWTTVKPPEYFSGVNSWRSKKGRGGVVLINLIHDIDVLQYLFGPITRIHAEKTISRRSDREDAVEEGAALTLRFLSGVVGTVLVSDAVSSPYSFEQGTGENPNLPRTGKDVYRVFGTKATISFPDMLLSSYDSKEPAWTEEIVSRRMPVDDIDALPLVSQLNHFVKVCEGKEPPVCTGEEGLRALMVCQAINKALDSEVQGGTVDIDMMSSKL